MMQTGTSRSIWLRGVLDNLGHMAIYVSAMIACVLVCPLPCLDYLLLDLPARSVLLLRCFVAPVLSAGALIMVP